MNKKIADAANAAMHDPDVESKKGMCSRFTRQVVAKVYGEKYHALFGGSAIDTGHNFHRAGLTVSAPLASQLQEGDILFKMQGCGGFGHVGIYVGNGRVASNSSTSITRVSGAKGYRTLEQWSHYDLVGRIPENSTATQAAPQPIGVEQPDPVVEEPIMYHLYLNDKAHKIADMPVHEGHALCPVRSWAFALGFDVDWDEDNKRIIYDGKTIEESPVLIGDHAYLPITTLVNATGTLAIKVNDAPTHTIIVGKK